MPEGVDGGRRAFVAGGSAGFADVFVAERGAETANDQACRRFAYGICFGGWIASPGVGG